MSEKKPRRVNVSAVRNGKGRALYMATIDDSTRIHTWRDQEEMPAEVRRALDDDGSNGYRTHISDAGVFSSADMDARDRNPAPSANDPAPPPLPPRLAHTIGLLGAVLREADIVEWFRVAGGLEELEAARKALHDLGLVFYK